MTTIKRQVWESDDRKPPETRSRMHFASHRSPGTQTHRLFNIMRDLEWHGGWDLTLKLPTTAISTVLAELKASLDVYKDPYRIEKDPRKVDGKTRHFYRLVQTRDVEVGLFDPSFPTGRVVQLASFDPPIYCSAKEEEGRGHQ